MSFTKIYGLPDKRKSLLIIQYGLKSKSFGDSKTCLLLQSMDSPVRAKVC